MWDIFYPSNANASILRKTKRNQCDVEKSNAYKHYIEAVGEYTHVRMSITQKLIYYL